jgi:hypothetical protein
MKLTKLRIRPVLGLIWLSSNELDPTFAIVLCEDLRVSCDHDLSLLTFLLYIGAGRSS